jgi:hypothetical protein
MQTIRKIVTRRVFNRAKGWEDVALRVELLIDDDAIMDRLAARAYKNKSGSSSFMHGAVVIRAKLA